MKPKNLLLIDASGAILSAFMLGVVLVELEHIFGIPPSTLYILALIPYLFVLYDLYAYFTVVDRLSTYLKGISLMNVLYCLISISFALYHFKVITVFGWIYIILELFVVLIIASMEYQAAKNMLV